VKSKEAESLLRKADRAIKASNATFVDVNIPEGHKKPLWSVLSNLLNIRQAHNPNNILIDISEKSKQFLTVKTLDNKGFVTSKIDVSPMPEYGSKNEFFPTSDLYRTYVQGLDNTKYGRSNFFSVIDNAEYEADSLLEEQLKNKPEIKTSLKLISKPKSASRDASVILNPRRIEKSRLKIKEHVQRPFENLRRILASVQDRENVKMAPAEKERIPRRIKKEMKKRSGM